MNEKKNRANTLSAILSNMQDLEGAYESALNAEGSALKENEAYLDSIQGRIDLFTNSLQTMWMNFISADVVKFIVDLGTGLINLIDKVGLLRTAFAGLMTYFNVSSKHSLDFASMFGIHDLEKGWTVGKDGLTGWITKQFKNITIGKGTINNLLKNVLGDTGDVEVTIQDFANAIKDNINDFVALDTSQIDTQIDSVQRKLSVVRQELVEAQQADWNYYKSLGSMSPATDRDTRIDEKVQEIKTLEAELSNLQAKRDEIVSSAVNEVATSAFTQVQSESKAYQSMLSVLSEVKDMKLSIGDEQNVAQKIDEISKAAQNGQTALTDYMSTLGDNDIALKAYVASVDDGNYSLAGFQKYIQQHNSSIEASGIAAKVAAVGHQLLNAAISMGISFILSTAISAIVEYAHRQEEIAEAANQAEDAIRSLSDAFRTDSKTVTDYAERFAELAQGVDMLTGKNLSLTTDDYEEFLDLSNQLAEIFPTLSRNYDENGNAIVQLSGDTDTMVGSLKDLLDVQRQITNQQIAENLPDLYKGVKQKSDTYNNELDGLESKLQTYQEHLKLIQGSNSETFANLFDGSILRVTGDDPEAITEIANQYLTLLGQLGYQVEELTSDYDDIDGNLIGLNYNVPAFGEMSDEQLEQAKQNIIVGVNALATTYSNEINNLNSQIATTTNENKANWGSLSSAIAAWLQTDSTYQVLDDDMQSMVQTVINNLDYSSLDFSSWEKAQEWIQDNILDIFTNLEIKDKAATALSKMFNLQSSFQNGNIDLGGYKEQLLSFVDFVKNSELADEVQTQLLKMFNIDPENEDSLGSNIDTMLNHAKKVISLAEKEFEKLSYSDLQIINSAQFNVDGATISTWKQLQYEIQQVKIAMTQDFTTDNFADYAESIGTISSSISTYQGALESLESGTFTLTDFMELIEEFPELADGVDASSKSFKGLSTNLRKAIRNFPDGLVDELKDLREQLVLAGKSTTSIDQLISSLENLPVDAVSSLSDEYITLADSIDKAKIAQTELEEAMSENSNEGYETRGEALEQMKTLLSEGQIGSESELWSIAEAYGFTYDSAKSINENADALAKFIAIREEWYKTDDDGNYTFDGTESFLNAVEKVVANNEKLKDLGVKWNYDDSTGKLDFDFNNANWDEIIGILSESEELAQLTSEEFYDLLMQVGQFFDINWQDADDLIWFLQQINNSAESAAENFDTTKNAVTSFLESAGYSTDLLELTVDDEEFRNLPEDVQNVLEEYYELKSKFEADPLSISWQLDKNTGDKLNEDSIESLSQLTTILKDNSSGTIFLDYTSLENAAREAGYTEEAIDDMIEKIKEYNNVCGITTSDEDLLGLISLQDDVEKAEQYLTALQLEFETVKNSDNTISYQINVGSAIDTLIAHGWTSADIQTYLTTLENAGIYSFTIDGAEVKLSTDDAQQKVSALIAEKEGISEGESTEYTVTGTGEASVDHIKTMWDNMPTSKSTNYSVYETTYKSTVDNGTVANGTAHIQGTAHATGSWGAQATETALVGELGPELLVRGSQWTTVGENGAEFRQIKKGDIIFNHKQTEQLLTNGYVTGRGKAYASGSGTFSKYEFSGSGGYTKYDVNGNVLDSFGNAASSLSGAASDISDASDEFKEVFDWIEVRLEEINKDIDLRSAQLENKVGYKAQNKTVDQMIDLNEKLYENLIAGANKYYSYASTLLAKIPAEYRQAAQDGTIAIETFTGEVGEETLEAIEEYREWVQKGDDAVQQAEEVITEVSSLAKQAIDNIATDFENKNSIRDNKIDQLEAYNGLTETKYGSESAEIYEAIIKATNQDIKELQSQRNKMQAELDTQVKEGNIIKYSQDWYDAINDIAALDTEIIELTKDTYDYQDAINELHWDSFDNLMSRYEALSDETDNLVDILGAKDLVDADTGKWTSAGVATLGLYAQQMEIAEMQASKYKEEINYLNKNWKKLGYTEQEYVEKLEELKDGQYDAIKAYNDTKDAIVDLNKERVDAIKDGIQKEIDAYEELIKKKKEELDAEKDAYDFQKTVANQQKNISDIERKIAALSSDNSASAKAQRAKLEAELLEAQAELQETYYDRSVSDQQDALDKELENFKEAKDEELDGWDEYLEDTEQVVSDSLSTIQTNTDVVYQTLKSMGKEYSISVAEALTAPWQDGETAIQSYSEKFRLSMSSTVEELQKVADEYKKVMSQIEGYGNKVVDNVNDSASKYQAANNPSKPKFDSPEKVVTPVTPSGGGGSSDTRNPSSHAGEISGLSTWLKQGSMGSDVKKLQQALNDLGFNAGTEDGNFGYNTKQAVMRFQRSSSYGGAISADGIVGPDTKKKFKAAGYAKGTTGVEKNQLALIDELGEELVLSAHNGRLAYLTKGTAVIPHDISENLMQLGTLDPQDILNRNRPTISAPHIINNDIELHLDIAEVVHIEHVDNDTVPNLAKTVERQIDKYMKNLNANIRKYTR